LVNLELVAEACSTCWKGETVATNIMRMQSFRSSPQTLLLNNVPFFTKSHTNPHGNPSLTLKAAFKEYSLCEISQIAMPQNGKRLSFPRHPVQHPDDSLNPHHYIPHVQLIQTMDRQPLSLDNGTRVTLAYGPCRFHYILDGICVGLSSLLLWKSKAAGKRGIRVLWALRA
jgi:hypothetical protein